MAYNPTAPLKGGFTYQDWCVLKLCKEWLLDPELYQWIRIECKLGDDSKFCFDDIVLLDSNNKYHVYQAKFKMDAGEQWNWDDFLTKSKKLRKETRGSTLFEQFSTSFRKIGISNIARAIFITNADLAEEVKNCIVESKIDMAKLKSSDQKIHNKILAVFKNQSEILNILEFQFEQKSYEELNTMVRKSFYGELKATKQGVDNLILEIGEAGRKPQTIEITLQNLRDWCEFDNPRSLNEEFEIPDDFQLFNSGKHEQIIADLKKKEGGVKIVYGKPGAGKSTYLSNLAKELSTTGFLVIKHHYYINPSDVNFRERLNSTRVIEAIKAQFKDIRYRSLLGDIANQNSAEIELREFISRVASKVKLIIIIDGLDHVAREKNIAELNSFIEEIFYPQKNLWIIFGTQPHIEQEDLVQQKLSKCLPEDRVEIQGLTRQGVEALVSKNTIELHLPKDEIIFSDFINKILKITEGNCLHLRYTLVQLKNNLENQLVTEYACENLVSYGKGIEQYYSDLWKTLGDKTKSFLLTLISISFQFTRDQFIDCVSSFIVDPSDISVNFKKIKHLIHETSKLSIYHTSFSDFLKKQNEWAEQKPSIQNKVKSWLEQSEYENLKWSELRRLEYETDNADPILKINRDWLINAISHPRNPSQIISQLDLVSKVALEKENFAKALEVGLLNIYYQNAQESFDALNSWIWIEAINNHPQFINQLNIKELPIDVLTEIISVVEHEPDIDAPRVMNEISEILGNRSALRNHSEEAISQDKAIVCLAAYSRTYTIIKIFEFIAQRRKNDSNYSLFLFQYYVKKLLILNQTTKIIELLEHSLTEDEKKAVLGVCIGYDLQHKASNFKSIIESEKNNSNLEKVYLHVHGVAISQSPELPQYDSLPATLEEHEHKMVAVWQQKFYDLFLIGLVNTLFGRSAVLKEWISSAPRSKWLVIATSALFKIATNIGYSILEKRIIDYQDISLELKGLPDIEWLAEDRGKIYFKEAMVGAIQNILGVVLNLKLFLNEFCLIKKNEYDIIVSTPFFSAEEMLNFAISKKRILFETEVCTAITDEKIKILQEDINYFSARSEQYLKLSKLNRLYCNKEKAKDLLLKSINNFLGYGYRKDANLFHVIAAMTACSGTAPSVEIQEWIKRIVPLIMNVGQYTDGAETCYLPVYLADFLAKQNQELLFKFFFSSSNDTGSLELAQKIFKHVIQSLKFTEDVEIALAKTALDKDSMNTLKEKAKTLKGAKEALNTIEQYLGETYYEDEGAWSSKDKKIDYSKIIPEKLEGYLCAITTPGCFNQYLTGWTRYHSGHNDKEKIYNLVKSIVLKKGSFGYAHGELLDILYPLAYEFDNTNQAFELLYLAHRNDYGWYDEMRDNSFQKRRRIRWDFLKSKYPKKYLEFFQGAVKKGFPVAIGAEFFVYMDRIDLAEEITEASIEFAEDLMADLSPPIPEWAKENYKKVDILDLLFYRLIWPSPLVQERAANAIGELLVHSPTNCKIYNRLLQWIKNWKIETIIAIGLLSIVRAFQICTDANKLFYIQVSNIKASVNVNSVVIEKLLQEIRQYKGERDLTFDQLPKIIAPPPSYKVSGWFHENIKIILPPIYLIRAEKITTYITPDFIRTWSYNAEIIAKESNIEIIANRTFRDRFQSDGFLRQYSPIIGEVYKSAFLRLVNGFYKPEKPNISLDFAFMTLPIDLSLWHVLPNSIPKWWPSLQREKSTKKTLTMINLKKPIKSVVTLRSRQNIVIAAEGVIKPSEGWKKNPEHSFTLIGFGYRVLGANIPNAENVYKQISHLGTTNPEELGIIGNHKYSDLPKSLKIEDIEIVPIVRRNDGPNISTWQFFRTLTPPFNVANEIKRDLAIKKAQRADCLSYKNQQAKNIITYQYWLAGLQERYHTYEMPIPHGHHLSIDEGFIVSKLHENDFKLGYVFNTIFRVQEHDYSEVKTIKSYELIKVV